LQSKEIVKPTAPLAGKSLAGAYRALFLAGDIDQFIAFRSDTWTQNGQQPGVPVTAIEGGVDYIGAYDAGTRKTAEGPTQNVNKRMAVFFGGSKTKSVGRPWAD
jgi:hypothetical protein